jgi:prepilin-type N-terminal cleavage/methylation domain-containing protein
MAGLKMSFFAIKKVNSKRPTRREKGFTLIELMIVIGIIGILAAIAIPQLAAYRNRGFNATSMSDLKNMVICQEAYFADSQTYSVTTVNLLAYGYVPSPGISATVVGANNLSYSMQASHASSDRTFSISGPGGIIQ